MSTGGLTLAHYGKDSPYDGAIRLSRGPNPGDLATMEDVDFFGLAGNLSRQGVEITRDTVTGKVQVTLETSMIDTHVHGRGGVAPGYRGDILMRLAQMHFTRHLDGLLYMPNTLGPLLVDDRGNPLDNTMAQGHIVTGKQFMAYRDLLNEHDERDRTHIITVSLTKDLTQETLEKLKDEPDFGGVKYYPAGATTNSESGNTHIDLDDPRLAYMAKHRIPFHIHPETSMVLGPDGYPIQGLASDAEREFVASIEALCQKFPDLPIVMEHISTTESVALIQKDYPHLYATVTSQHLLLCEGDVNTGGGVLLHNGVCRPTVKGSEDLRAIQTLVLSGHPRVMMGTDSAPHFNQVSPEARERLGISRSIKEDGCCANGVISSPDVVRMMWQFFEENGKLEHFAGFMGRNAVKAFPEIWGNTLAQKRVLVNAVGQIATKLSLPGQEDVSVVPMLAGTRLKYTYL